MLANTLPLTLVHSPTSPFVRKVLLVIHEGGIAGNIKINSLSPWVDNNPVAELTPTGKIPALIISDDPSCDLLSDSKTICHYLNDRFSLNFLPHQQKYKIQHLESIADNLIEAVVNIFIEHNKREATSKSDIFLARWQSAVERCVKYLEKNNDLIIQKTNIATLTTATALGYLNLRLPSYNWQTEAPILADWFNQFKHRLSMQATAPTQ